MGLSTLIKQDPLAFALLAVFLMYSIILHEIAHGFVARMFGDHTAEEEGRITLNPVSHVDPLGLLMVFLVGFGWAKPVPVNYYHLRQRGRTPPILVSVAGVFVNFLLACAAVLALLAVPKETSLATALSVAVRVNVGLAAFNLIPIPPLDGSRVVAEFLPPGLKARFFRAERFGFFVLILLLYFRVLDPVIRFMQYAVITLMSVVLKPFL